MLDSIATFISSFIIAFGGFIGLVPEQETIVVTAPPAPVEENLGSFAPAAGGTYRLKSSIGTTNTSITLSSFKEPVSELPITMGSLNSDIGYATIDPQSSTRKEFISFTGVTQNSDGSATLTGVSRGLAFTSPFTASTTLRRAHPGQSILILSDSPQLFLEYARRRADETITGSWTIPTPTAAGNPATKAYVDSVVAGGSVSLDSISMSAVAGETFAAGTIVYFDNTAIEWLKADASALATSVGVQLGIAQGAGTNGATIDGGVLTRGYDTTQGDGTPGQTIYLSDTGGATSTSAGTVPVVLGEYKASGQFYFDPIYGNIAHKSGDNTLTGANTFSATTSFPGGTDGVGNIQVFTTDGTWTKPTTSRFVEVYIVGGGGGASSGAKDTSGGSGEGGGGGGGGGFSHHKFNASTLSATVAVTVGEGGAGGATTTSATPNNGTAGENSSFGAYLIADGGSGGSGDNGGSGGDGSIENGGAGGEGDNGGGGSAGTSSVFYAATGGGGGGEETSSTEGKAGGSKTLITQAGGASGSPDGGDGTVFSLTDSVGGTGGAGGDGVAAGSPGDGGDGAFPGGGGGGGGGTGSGSTAGAGGSGANGIVIVITY